MRDNLTSSIAVTHHILSERLRRAAQSAPTPERPRARFPTTDTFLASTSRHVGAINAVLVPAVRRLGDDGQNVARDLVERSRRLEWAMAQAKAKLYGSTYAIRRSWTSIWADVHERFEELLTAEEAAVERLGATIDEQARDDLSDRIYQAELSAPTRPHPYLPHRGLPGRMARGVAHGVDRFWDTAEGRMIPEPVRIRDHSRDGRLTQYLLAQSRLPEE